MRKLFLFFMLCATFSFALAQSFTDGDSHYVMDYSSTSSSCLNNLGSSNGGPAFVGGNVSTAGYSDIGSNDAIQFTATTGTLNSSEAPYYYDIYYTNEMYCESMVKHPWQSTNPGTIGINLSSNPKVILKAKANTNGTKIRFYIGSSAAEDYPETSTFNVTGLAGWCYYR